MPKEKNISCLPLQLVKDFEKSYPGCYREADDMHFDNGAPDMPTWDKLCYIPIAATMSIMQMIYRQQTPLSHIELAAYASWRQYKEIYSFDADFLEMLEQDPSELLIPLTAVRALPYPCVYIDIGGYNGMSGFFVWFEAGAPDELELRFLLVSLLGDKFPFILHLSTEKEWTVADGVNDAVKTAKKNVAGSKEFDRVAEMFTRLTVERFRYMIPLVLYLCAQNAEIEENPRQKAITRKPTRPAYIKDAYREVRKWDVGVRIGKAIRASRSASTSSGESSERTVGERRPPRPHTRRGHWHHYWAGSEKDDTRRLILKWQPPTFVGAADEDAPAVVHKVKSEKNK